MRSEPGATRTASFLSGGGRMGELLRSHDWGSTSLGPVETWPQSLQSAVSIMLNSRYPIALYWGPELALLYNDAWSPIPGGKHPWALGRPGREVWPEIWDTIGPLYDQVLTTGEGIWQEDQLLPMDRHGYVEECYFNFTFSPVRGGDGKIEGIFNAVVETTDRVLSERRLRTLSRMGGRANPALSIQGACRWAADILADNPADIPFGLIYLSGEGGTDLAATFGSKPQGLRVEDLSWPFEAAAEKAVVVAVPSAWPSDYWSEPVAQVVAAPISAPGVGSPIAYLVAGANPRRQVDLAYLSFFELTAAHIGTALSTARAYEDERRRAEALAEIDRAKTAFFSNVSHEFRTPLTLMLGPLEDALAESSGPLHERLELAHRNALRLQRMVNALLDFSRLEAGRVDAKFRPTDLASATADLASTFRAAVENAGLRFDVDAHPLSAPVFIDTDMWEKIVLNLLSNAFKFTFEGGITVRVREIDGRAEVTVADTGTGIPQGELPRIFERFHRVSGSRGRTFEGSGIGLSLVHELVMLHGGEISVDSVEGEGTTFSIRLPFGAGHLPAELVQADAKPPRTPAGEAFVQEALRWLPRVQEVATESLQHYGTASGGGGAVLLADDNADLRLYIAQLLGDAGYVVEAVPDGEAALASLRTSKPDVILTDVMMPKLDGFGLLGAVRQDSGLRDLPVIMLSARAGEEATVEGIEAGADDYLIKPFSGRELVARVSGQVALARLRRETEERLRRLNAELEQRVQEAIAEKKVLVEIIESADSPAQAIDAQYRFLAINATAKRDYERTYGVVPEIGESLMNLLAPWPTEQARARQAWGKALAGESYESTAWWGADDAGRRAYDMRFKPLFGPGGEVAGAYLFGLDITDRLREQDRRAAAEEALRQSQKMEAMGQLTGGVAHDFNNLLTPIIGSLDLLQRNSVGGKREQRLISAAVQSAERAKTLVHRLLAFARRQPLQPTAVDVADLVRGMGELIRSTTGPQVRVITEIAPGLPAALADPNQLEMALLNLAVNGRDAMPDGGTLRISAVAERIEDEGEGGQIKAGEYVRLSVSDTGHGMDDETRRRAIEPFFSTKGIGRGTGLGLSMVHGVAAQLGGRLLITSHPGVGTDVELWLPITPVLAKTHSGATSPARTRFAGTVLLVDDEELVRATTSDMLAELGYRVIEAAAADEALARVRDGLRPDLLVTDHLMPGMRGTELVRRVRELSPTLPAIVISGYAEMEGVAPDLDCLTKPFRHSDLADAITRAGAKDR